MLPLQKNSVVRIIKKRKTLAWSIDDLDQPDEQRLKLLQSALKSSTRHIEDVYRFKITGATTPES